MCPILPLKWNRNAGYCNENLPDAGCSSRSDYVVCALAERAILMGCTVHMDVRKLDCGAKEENEHDEPNEQIANPRVLWTNWTDPSHGNCHYSSRWQVCQLRSNRCRRCKELVWPRSQA
jgi:hypothetical protein